MLTYPIFPFERENPSNWQVERAKSSRERIPAFQSPSNISSDSCTAASTCIAQTYTAAAANIFLLVNVRVRGIAVGRRSLTTGVGLNEWTVRLIVERWVRCSEEECVER